MKSPHRGLWFGPACAVVVGLLAVGCQTPGIGSVPPALVSLYDDASPVGTIEIEVDRDGSIREMEADIEVADLPEKIIAAAKEYAPGIRITGAEREVSRHGDAWEVKFRHDGRAHELVIGDNGKIREIEKELNRSEAPSAVLEGADKAVSGGSFLSVELITIDGEGDQYHVKKSRQGATYKIVLDEEGNVLRKVREAKAEIEIPLAD